MTYKIGIVEDEVTARSLIEVLLEKYFPGKTHWLFEAGSVTNGRKHLSEHTPDILFLDINISGGESFELLDLVDSNRTQVIYVTAYNEHAIRALRSGAVDYLMKPINHKEFKAAVEKAMRRCDQQTDRYSYFLKVPEKNGAQLVETKHITYLEADGAYTHIYQLEGVSLTSSRNLALYEEKLSQKGFIRIHRSFLVNSIHIKRVKNQNEVELRDGTVLSLSRRRSAEVEEYLRKMFE